jgi:hypothetical protein
MVMTHFLHPGAHYAPLQTTPWNEQVTWTFPTNAATGGRSYRIFGGPPDVPVDPATGTQTGPARVGSMQSGSTYSDFFTAADLGGLG